MTTPSERLAEMGIELPDTPAPAAAYQPWREAGGLVFTAGQLPKVDGELPATGKLGTDVTVEQGQELARAAAINILAVAEEALGIDRTRIVKLTVFVASAPGFTEQHLVANGASEFLGEVLGDHGLHARSAVGVPVLPLDSPVEIEAVLEAHR